MTGLASDIEGMEQARTAMVASQLRTVGVDDMRVLGAMARVPREDFLPGADVRLAYRDGAVPLGDGRFQNAPMATGLLLNAARLRDDDRVLLIGATGGYTAAVLARIVARVTAVECDAVLAAHARRALAAADGVTLVEGPLAEGHAADAPYDVIVVDGAIEAPGAALAAQLAEGGRCVAGLAERGVTRLAAGASAGGVLGMVAFGEAAVVPLPGFAVAQGFSFRGV